jgi:Spy/CpxP family protein refolding chaperone
MDNFLSLHYPLSTHNQRNFLMKRFFMLMVAATVISFSPAYAENAQSTNMQILLDKVKADKKLLIASNMDLTDQESQKFWPLYENYQKELEKLNRHLGQIINEYAEAYNKGAVPEDTAKKLINEALKTEGAEVKMRRELAEQLIKVLPAQKVARYLQMENKIRSAIKYDLAANIPLVY